MTLCCFAPLLCASVFFWQIKRSKANRGPAGSVAAILNEHIWGNTEVCDCSGWFFTVHFPSRPGCEPCPHRPLCVTSPKRVAPTPWTKQVGRRVVSPHERSAMKNCGSARFYAPIFCFSRLHLPALLCVLGIPPWNIYAASVFQMSTDNC